MIAAAAVVVAASALATDATASRYLKTGIFDDAQVLYGTPEEVFPLLKTTRSQLLRVNIWWFGPGISVAKRKPKRPADPADPAYDWTTYDRTVRFAAANGMQVVFSIIGTPPWANAARGWNAAPTKEADLRAFATAAATRYSGAYKGPDGNVLPRVASWIAWNEPNNPVFMRPQFVRAGNTWVIQSAKDYARICNAIVTGIHSVARRQGGLRGDGPAREQQPEHSPCLRVATCVPPRHEEGRREGVRRLRAPSVLRERYRDAVDEAPAREEGAGADRGHPREPRSAHR